MGRTMKYSGIPWIGDIPYSWKTYRHKYVMHKEKTLCEHYNGEDIISLTMNGVIIRDLSAGGKMPTTFDGYQYVEPEDLLLCLFDIDVTPRCIGLVKDYGLTSPAYSRFKVHDGFFNAYYDYLLRTIDDKKVFVHLSKNLRSSLTESDFGVLPTIAPPYEEQRRIADFLDSECSRIDAVIEQTRASVEEYKKLKQAVITQAVTKGIRPNRPMKDSGSRWIGMIPIGWNAIISRFIFDQIGDVDYYMPESADTGIAYVMTGDLKKTLSEIDFETCKKISRADYEALSKKIKPSIGDIIFARYATIGTVCYVDSERDYIVSYSCVTIKPTKDKLHGKYLYYYLQASTFFEDVSQYINSNTQGNVGIEALYKVKIPIPPLEEQREISDYLDGKMAEIDGLIEKKKQLLSELAEYKKSLIYEYVTGKKEVPA